MSSLSAGSLLDAAVAAFGLDLAAGVQLWEAGALLSAAYPNGMPAPNTPTEVRPWAETSGVGAYTPPAAPFPLAPSAPALLWWRPAEGLELDRLGALLTTRYPADHPVKLAGLNEDGSLVATIEGTLNELPGTGIPHSAFCILHSAATADHRGAEGLRWVMARLLGPGGCPWDVRQSHQSLRGALLEEAHEALEALDAGDMEALSEELGDLLIAIFAHSEMARQAGHFAIEDVFAQIIAKLIRRHPHVFGSVTVDGEGQVVHNWEQIKAAERAAKGRVRDSAIDGVPPTLPGLAAAQALGRKAVRVGFNWDNQAQVWAKLHEELNELANAADEGDLAHAAEELGDTLFVLTRLADWMGLDAEAAMREANQKFRRRFTHLETAAAAQGRLLRELPVSELIVLWNEAKRL